MTNTLFAALLSLVMLLCGGCVGQKTTSDDTVYINTRVVIEVSDVSAATSYKDVEASLRYAEFIFKEANVRFVVTKKELIPECRWSDMFVDGHKHPEYLNIYISRGAVLVNDFFIIGASYMPDENISQGTLVVYNQSPINTIAHEIGHTLGGLKHTFEDDGCSDTCTPPEYKGDYLTYNNLMNYHTLYGDDFVTPQQIVKFKENVRKFGAKRILQH